VLPSTGTLILPLTAFPVLGEEGGSIRLYAGLDQTLIVTRSGTTFYALGSRCSRAGCPVGTYVAANESMRCGCHGSEYSIDGTVKRGPALEPLDRFPAVFHGGSEVRITVPNVTFGARMIQVVSESGGSRRFKLTFNATPFRDYRIEYRASLPGVARNHPVFHHCQRSGQPDHLPRHHPRARPAPYGSLRRCNGRNRLLFHRSHPVPGVIAHCHLPQTSGTILHPMSRPDLHQLRPPVGETAFPRFRLATLPERTPKDRLRQVRRLTRDRQQILPLRLQGRDGSLQGAGVGVARIGEDRLHRGRFHDPARIHHVDGTSQISETKARSCVMKMTAVA